MFLKLLVPQRENVVAHMNFSALEWFGTPKINQKCCTVNSRFKKDLNFQIHLHNALFWTTGFYIQYINHS